MLDGKIQKLIMFLDQHIDPGHLSRLKRGVDGTLDEIAEQMEELETKLDNLRKIFSDFHFFYLRSFVGSKY